MSKYGHRPHNWFEAIVNKLGGEERAEMFLRGELQVVEVTESGSEEPVIPTAPTPATWTVDDEGNIHFTVTSNGFTWQQWERHLKSRGFCLFDRSRNALLYANEAPTSGVAYHVVVRPGKKISDRDRITKKIRAAAKKKGWQKPHWEVACLIRDIFSDEQLEKMGLWWIFIMHEPIINQYGGCELLSLGRGDSCGGPFLNVGSGLSHCEWVDGGGFAFVESQTQTSPQS